VRTPKRVVRTRGPPGRRVGIPAAHRQASLRQVTPPLTIGGDPDHRGPERAKDVPVELLWFITVPFVIVLTVLTIVDVVRHKHGGGMAGWIVLVVFFPVIGSLIYWVARKPEPGEAERAYRAESDVRDQNQRLPSNRAGF
jgi:hypothetical protein